MTLKLSKDDIEAISRVVESEVGGTPMADRPAHIKAVVDTMLNRGAINFSDYGGIQKQLNAPKQFSAVNGNKNAVGSWDKLPKAQASVLAAVKDRIGEVFATQKTQPFVNFANPTPPYSSESNIRNWINPMRADPATVTVGNPNSKVYHVYGRAPGAPEAPATMDLKFDRNALYPGMAADTVDRNFDANLTMARNTLYPGMAADTVDRNLAVEQAKPQPEPGFFSFGGFMPQKPADMTLQDAPQPSYEPLSSMHPPSIDVARDLMRGITPPANVPAPDTTPLAPAMSSLYGQGSMVNLHAPWSVEGAQQPPAMSRTAAPQISMQGTATLGAGVGGQAGFARKFTDPFSNPHPLPAEAGAYSPPSLPGWTVHDTPPGPRAFSPPGRQPSMGAFTQASTGAPQAPSPHWTASPIPSFNQPFQAPRSTAQAVPPVTRSIAPAPSTPLPKNMAEALPSWASLAAAASMAPLPGLGMLAAMPAAVSLAQKVMPHLPALQQPAVDPTATVAPTVAAPYTPPRPKPVAPVYAPAPAAPQISQSQRVEANNPFTAAGLTSMGQTPLGHNLYGGGFINGVQQVFSGNAPSNAFGGLGYGNPFSGLGNFFNNTVQRAQAVPSNVSSFLGGLFGGGGGAPTNGGSGGFGGGFGGGSFGGGGWGGGPGSPGHRDSSH